MAGGSESGSNKGKAGVTIVDVLVGTGPAEVGKVPLSAVGSPTAASAVMVDAGVGDVGGEADVASRTSGSEGGSNEGEAGVAAASVVVGTGPEAVGVIRISGVGGVGGNGVTYRRDGDHK